MGLEPNPSPPAPRAYAVRVAGSDKVATLRHDGRAKASLTI
jgi:hypothetical protein